MMKTIFFLLLLLVVKSFASSAQNFSNLDFEYGVYKEQPRKWSIEGEGEKYTAKLDSTVRHHGKRSLYVTLKNAEVFIFLSIPRENFVGKEVRIDGYIKSSSRDSLQTMFMLLNPKDRKTSASKPFHFSTNDWEMISHKDSIATDFSGDRLLMALMAGGTGRFWFDNVSITINGVVYGSGATDFNEPTSREIDALNKHLLPITRSMASLHNLTKGATLVALGENSHGSSTLYKLKLEMVKYLIEKEDFSIFALESPMVEADRINDYVVYDKGTQQEVIQNLVYPSWQTREMLDIVEWIRSYNKTAKKKIEFRGFDMQDGTSALQALEDFASRYDTALNRRILSLKELNTLAKENGQDWKKVHEKSEEVQRHFLSRENSFYPNVDPMILEKMKQYMTLFVQSVTTKFRSEKTKSRDEYMAQNINWMMKRNGKHNKIIISADNNHITKASGKMGSVLDNLYGQQYNAFGFTFNSGTYWAYGSEKYYEVHPSYVGTYEYFFSRGKAKNFFFDLRNSPEIPTLNQRSGFRSIGSRPQETTQFAELNLKDHFDVIVYVENSTHTAPFQNKD